MEAGYYWARLKFYDQDMPPEIVKVGHAGLVYRIAVHEGHYPEAFDFFGKVLPYRAPVARIQSPYAPDGKTLVSFRVNVPGGPKNGSTSGLPWQWIVRAYNVREARKVLCQTFAIHRTPHGTTFTRIEKP